jgi:short-subunit dehydrogenase
VSSKVAVITGASRGLGYSLARRFAREGCDLAIISRNIEKLEYAKKKIIESHPEVKVLPLKCDLRDQSEITNAISKIDKTFRIREILETHNNQSFFRKRISWTQ